MLAHDKNMNACPELDALLAAIKGLQQRFLESSDVAVAAELASQLDRLSLQINASSNREGAEFAALLGDCWRKNLESIPSTEDFEIARHACEHKALCQGFDQLVTHLRQRGRKATDQSGVFLPR